MPRLISETLKPVDPNIFCFIITKLPCGKRHINLILAINYFVVFLASMSLFFTSLNSGSNGNCYYVGSSSEAVLVDAGISCRETEKRMRSLGLDMNSVKAIFISHEHSDHITGLQILSKKYQLPVYITHHTLQQSNLRIDQNLVRSFSADQPMSIGNLSVTAFKKSHDACDPHSFVISDGTIHVGVFTDIGIACPAGDQVFQEMSCCFFGIELLSRYVAHRQLPDPFAKKDQQRQRPFIQYAGA